MNLSTTHRVSRPNERDLSVAKMSEPMQLPNDEKMIGRVKQVGRLVAQRSALGRESRGELRNLPKLWKEALAEELHSFNVG